METYVTNIAINPTYLMIEKHRTKTILHKTHKLEKLQENVWEKIHKAKNIYNKYHM